MKGDQAKDKRLPLTVIGGFLGAGKTTLLNHWLRHADGLRLAVLVNDFGALNIDAGLIEASASDTIALTNGCVCCQIGDDLTRALIRLLESGTAYDAVVIEASGVSDPWRIAQMGRADPGLSLDGVIVMVDACTALEHARDPLLTDTLECQLRAADLIVLNKSDLANADELAALRRWIGSVAGPVTQFETQHAVVPIPMLSGLALSQVGQFQTHNLPHGAHAVEHDRIHDDGEPEHGALFSTWSCQPTHVFEPETLRVWLRNVPNGVLRLKGVLRTSSQDNDNPWSELQFAGRHGSLHKTSAPQAGAALVAISLRGHLPADALSAMFDAPD